MHALRAPLLDAPPLRRFGLPAWEYRDNPAAGAHFVEELGGLYIARLITLHARLVTDANVANRTVLVEYRDAADARLTFSGAPVLQTATTTTDWLFNAFQGQAEWTIDDSILIPLSPNLLPPTFDFRVFVDNIQAGDQLSRIRFKWERFYSDVDLT